MKVGVGGQADVKFSKKREYPSRLSRRLTDIAEAVY